MDSDGDIRRKTKQDKNKQTNKQNRRKVTQQKKQTKLHKTRKQKQMHVGLERAPAPRGGIAYRILERGRSQNLPKMTHFCHDIFCSDEGRKWE